MQAEISKTHYNNPAHWYRNIFQLKVTVQLMRFFFHSYCKVAEAA